MPLKSDAENTPIVLDVGEVYTKVGISGDTEPRVIIPTLVPEEGKTSRYLYKHEHNSIEGYQLSSSFKKDVHKFLSNIYLKYLQVDPKHHSVVICESLFSPSKFRHTLADVLFTEFQVPSILFAPHHLLACFTVASASNIVVECGWGESTCIPVVNWTPLLWKWHSAPVGAAAIHRSIRQKIKDHAMMRSEDKDEVKIGDLELCEKVVEDIKVRTCFVTTKERSDKIRQQKSVAAEAETPSISAKIPRVTFRLSGSTILYVPGEVREQSAEVLFEQDSDRTSICTIVLDCLLKSPVDTVKELSRNIILMGGTAMLPGFKHRFLVELNHLVKTESRYQEALAECEFRLHDPPTISNLVSWLGASILGSLKEFKKKYITQDYYKNNNKKIPDWCITNLPTPESQVQEKQAYNLPGRKSQLSAYSRTSRIMSRLSKDFKKL